MNNPFKPRSSEWVPKLAVALGLLAIALLLIVVMGAHDVEEAKCAERGGRLICPYMSRCRCIDREAFR